jgi:23S rRNA (guanosine2251-2'-O)-methyltransferase|tara:strand:+ start:272 stop:1015 length:744 start_codon:yes stop_codon:yes gene_type:complete
MTDQSYIYGINTILDTLKYDPELFIEIYMKENSDNKRFKEIIFLATEKNIPIRKIPKSKLDKLASTAKNQGLAALIRHKDKYDSKSAIKYLDSLDNPLVLILDGLEDPRNIGACYRTANSSGVDMVVIPKNRVSLDSPVISKVSSGASELTNTAYISNLSSFIKDLKKIGIWICGTSDTAMTNYNEIDFNQPIAIVIGSEGKGIRHLTEKNCDYLVSIPMRGQVDSLNVSVACGILVYEVLRQRQYI